MATQICGKCNGSGYLEQYKHVANGVCFNCDGHGRVTANGKIESITVRMIAKPAPGLNRTQTADLLDFIRSGANESYVSASKPVHKDVQKLIAEGYFREEIRGSRRYFVLTEKMTAMDWSLVSEDYRPVQRSSTPNFFYIPSRH